jgi:hypothetical protein
VTFELKNDGASDLNFATTKGWQPVIFAFTGKPPKAKSILMFPTACTASCDSDASEICPVCPEPKNKKEEEQMAKHETATAGSSLTVAWDGKVFAYEKAKVPGKKCQCWRKVDPPAETYTVKACGLRASKEAGTASRPVCAQTSMVLPLTEPSTTVTVTFPTK